MQYQKFYTTNQVAKLLNMHPTTLYGYVKVGFVSPKKLPTGRLRWTDDDIAKLLQHLNLTETKQVHNRAYLYVRISQPAKEHLDNQLQVLKQYAASKSYTITKIITDTASSFNFRRPGLQQLLKHALKSEFDILVIYSKDRLSRLAYDFFEMLFEQLDITIDIVIEDDKPIEQWQMTDIAEELISFVHYLSSKIYGSRTYKRKLKQLEQEIQHEYGQKRS